MNRRIAVTRTSANCLAITYTPITQLHADPRNARVHSPRQIKQLAKSIETFAFVVPVLVDAQGRVLAGHGRLLAAQKLGMHLVPCPSGARVHRWLRFGRYRREYPASAYGVLSGNPNEAGRAGGGALR